MCTLAAAAAREDGAPSLPVGHMTAYTGGLIDVGWGFEVVIDMAGLDFKGHQRPILLNHNPDNILGHSTRISREGGTTLLIEWVLSGTGPAAQEVKGNAANKFPYQASVGVKPRNIEFVRAGSSAKANGQVFEGPCYIVRKGVLRESSVVALGADLNTSTSIAARLNHGDTMTFEAWLKASGFDPATITEAQRATLQAAFDASVQAEEPGAPAPAAPATP